MTDLNLLVVFAHVVEANSRPLVLLTSNNTRELTEALKRRCLYLWLDYPDVERELEIVRLHAPELDSTVATYKWDGERGSLEPLQVQTTLPPSFTGNNTSSEIAVAP